MSDIHVDILVVGAGPVGLMCAHLSQLCGLKALIIDKTDAPLEKGRADALNARTLQLLDLAGLFDQLYPLGKPCNTSSVWHEGKFISRQSTWWDELKGCFHKHFLMLGQSYLEKALDEKLEQNNAPVWRCTSIESLTVDDKQCLARLSNGCRVHSPYVIGADGARSFVRNHFAIPFDIRRPQMIWAVIDAVIETDFPKVPEIIVFQSQTSDVAWIPREGSIDRFYVRMDTQAFTLEQALFKINQAMKPHKLRLKKTHWVSQFSVKESVAANFFVKGRVFLAGDACHIHSVNGGQGLNTGLADAFNLIWKLNMVLRFKARQGLLMSYQKERKPVAQGVIETSGQLVRSTKYSTQGTHAKDYMDIIKKRAGYITGMGIHYGQGQSGSRLYDFEVYQNANKSRIYQHLDYSKYNLLMFGQTDKALSLTPYINCIQIHTKRAANKLWCHDSPYQAMAVLVRPDAYIESLAAIEKAPVLIEQLALNGWGKRRSLEEELIP